MTTAAKTIAAAAEIAPRTNRVEIYDQYGFVTSRDMTRAEVVLTKLAWPELAPGLDARIHTVAYALRKSMFTGRMNPGSMLRISAYSPYQLCKLVARIATECPETTIGGICDVWLRDHHNTL